MNDRIWLSSPCMNGEEMRFVKEAFDSNWVAPLGANVDGFEQDICDYTGAKEAVAMNSGTGAIHMAYKYLGVGEGDVVFCSSLTFSATCNPIIYQNAKPVFIDSEPDTWNMSPVALRKAFEKYTPKAVIVVHLYGVPAKMREIIDICKEHNVPLIEDAAESLGAVYEGRQTGTLGEIGIYSFNGNKIITTSGGGMLVCHNKETKDKISKWITQSRDKAPHYQHSELGFNYRMSNICAGIGRGQMLTLAKRVEQKTHIYDSYKEAFADIDSITLNPYMENITKPNFWLSCITLSDTDITPSRIMEALGDDNIESRPIWKPMHLQPFFAEYDFFNHNDEGMSVSEDIFNRGLCLPSDSKMTDEDLKRVINIVKSLF